jgi:CheY-like chemotaxis protein
MLQAQKLESLGVLAGGIAHDFNNLLVGIMGNASLALMELSPESPARQTIQEIQLAGERAAELARQMLAYSGKGRFVIEALNLNALVEEMGHLLHASISKNVVINYDFARDLPPIEADATQIRQVIMNLVVNASEAIGDKNGVIAIRTRAVQIDGNHHGNNDPLKEAAAKGEYVLCEITDTGCGMDQITQSKIFDPFFTTKFTGRGLGLAAVLGIVRGHRGLIKVISEPDKGTSFRILFPAVPVAKARSDMTDQTARQTLHQFSFTGKALVIDDDDTVRTVTARLLKTLGISAILAHDGLAGLRLFERHAPEIGCVLLDLTMPKPSGEEVFKAIRRLRPDTPIIIMSGYNEEDAADRFAGYQITGFLHKPYTPEQLEQLLFKAFPRSDA